MSINEIELKNSVNSQEDSALINKSYVTNIPSTHRSPFSFLLPQQIKCYIGIYDVFGGIISQRFGFDGLWIGSYQICLSEGLQDDQTFNPLISLELAIKLKKHSINLPIIIDLGSGFLNEDDLEFFSNEINKTNVVAVCIDDNKGIRTNSMFNNTDRCLLSADEFVNRITHIRNHLPSNIHIIARTELLTIYGKNINLDDLNNRLFTLQRNHVDVFLPHYVGDDYSFISDTIKNLDSTIPIMLIPTGLLDISQIDFFNQGISLIVYANLDIRGRFKAIKKIYSSILTSRKLDNEHKRMLAYPKEIKRFIESE